MAWVSHLDDRAEADIVPGFDLMIQGLGFGVWVGVLGFEFWGLGFGV